MPADPLKPAYPVRSLSIVLPCLNEEGNVERVVGEALSSLGDHVPVLEVIVVNDGSSDRTGPIADALAKRDPRVKVVHHPRNLGYGASLRDGFAAASSDWVFFTDGDGQFDIGQVRNLTPSLATHDAVIGWRIKRADPPLRRLNGWGWSRVVNTVFGMRFRDIDCAFKILPAERMKSLGLVSTGSMISAEMLARLNRAGLRIAQVGVHHRPRTHGQQTGNAPHVILRAFRELFSLAGRIRRGG